VLLVPQPLQDQKGRKMRKLTLQNSVKWHSDWPLARRVLLAKVYLI